MSDQVLDFSLQFSVQIFGNHHYIYLTSIYFIKKYQIDRTNILSKKFSLMIIFIIF